MNFRTGTCLYIGNLSINTNQDSLKEMLSSIGQVVKADVVLNDNSRSRRCYAVVEMLNQNDADHVIEKLNGKLFEGRVMQIKRISSKFLTAGK